MANTDRRYRHNGTVFVGNPIRRPVYKIDRLSNHGWTDTGQNVSDDDPRSVFRLGDTEALLYREQGGCVVEIVGAGMVKFFPPDVPFSEVTEWAQKMTAIPFNGEMCPEPINQVDEYGQEARG